MSEGSSSVDEWSGWEQWGEAQFRSAGGSAALKWSKAFVLLTVLVAALHLASHLRSFSRPRLQRHVVRIIFMTPIYACCSYLTLVTGYHWPNVLRDIYEAWVIYCFLAILFESLGGEAAIANHVKDGGCPPLPSRWFWGTCCLDPLWTQRISFLKFCKAGTLQFALIKPICAVAQLILEWAEIYAEGEYLRVDRGFVYVALIYNTSISLAIYALVLFYIAMREKLGPFRPVLKYLTIKSVIFLSYWQGFMLQLVAPSVTVAGDAQNFLITIEMAFAALAMAAAFPASQFQAKPPPVFITTLNDIDQEEDSAARSGSAQMEGDKAGQSAAAYFLLNGRFFDHVFTKNSGAEERSMVGALKDLNTMASNLGQAVNLRDVADETRTIFGTGYQDHAMLGEGDDDLEDLERGSFSDLARAKGKGGLAPVGSAAGGGGGGMSVAGLGRRVSSLGKKASDS